MTEVRKHQRQAASGKRTTVRHHTRGGDKTDRREDEAEAAREAWADRNAPHVSSLPPAESEPQAQEWWAEDDRPPPGEFWDEDDAGEDGEHLHPDWHNPPKDEPDEPSDAFKAMQAQNPSIGDGFDRLFQLRQSGYEGPVDQDGNPTDRKAARKAAVHRLKVAQEALAANAELEQEQGIDWETPRFHKLNNEYWAARKAQDVPWWRRG